MEGLPMTKFNKEFLITFRDTDRNGKLKTNVLVDFMQDIARADATDSSVNFESPNTEYYWIIIRNKINLWRTPMIGETIRIETFHSGLDRLYAVREFHIYDQDDHKLGNITGYYLLMQHDKARPVKIRGNESLAAFDIVYTGEKIDKLSSPSGKLALQMSHKRRVFSSEIDGNGHMNNAHYVRWCFDMYDTNELMTKDVKSFQIQYTKELLENAEISINRYADGYVVGEDEQTIYFIGKIEFEDI